MNGRRLMGRVWLASAVLGVTAMSAGFAISASASPDFRHLTGDCFDGWPGEVQKHTFDSEEAPVPPWGNMGCHAENANCNGGRGLHSMANYWCAENHSDCGGAEEELQELLVAYESEDIATIKELLKSSQGGVYYSHARQAVQAIQGGRVVANLPLSASRLK